MNCFFLFSIAKGMRGHTLKQNCMEGRYSKPFVKCPLQAGSTCSFYSNLVRVIKCWYLGWDGLGQRVFSRLTGRHPTWYLLIRIENKGKFRCGLPNFLLTLLLQTLVRSIERGSVEVGVFFLLKNRNCNFM